MSPPYTEGDRKILNIQGDYAGMVPEIMSEFPVMGLENIRELLMRSFWGNTTNIFLSGTLAEIVRNPSRAGMLYMAAPNS